MTFIQFSDKVLRIGRVGLTEVDEFDLALISIGTITIRVAVAPLDRQRTFRRG